MINAIPEEMVEAAKKDASKFLKKEEGTATVVNKLIQDNTAYIILRSNGKEITIQYDLTTRKMLWHNP